MAAKHRQPIQPFEKKSEAYHAKMDKADHMTQMSGGTETHKGMGSGETTMRDASKPLDGGSLPSGLGKVLGGRVDSGD